MAPVQIIRAVKELRRHLKCSLGELADPPGSEPGVSWFEPRVSSGTFYESVCLLSSPGRASPSYGEGGRFDPCSRLGARRWQKRRRALGPRLAVRALKDQPGNGRCVPILGSRWGGTGFSCPGYPRSHVTMRGTLCLWRNGIRASPRCWCPRGRAGSNPARRTYVGAATWDEAGAAGRIGRGMPAFLCHRGAMAARRSCKAQGAGSVPAGGSLSMGNRLMAGRQGMAELTALWTFADRLIRQDDSLWSYL